ncbi:MAG TPA: hypothetical protein VK619_05130 [Pyrinomonadaceae bacterium]|nr:hypothetical protein [Pyrinomonadaceae bacterium]
MMAGVGIVGITSSVKHVFAQPLDNADAPGAASSVKHMLAHKFDDAHAWREALSVYPLLAQQFDNPDAWRHQVQNLTSTLDFSLGSEINPQIMNANLVERPDATDTHTAYASRLLFNGWNLRERKVVCDNAYAIQKFPLYDVSCTCEQYRDLNYSEIGSFISSYEYNRFKCVLVPAGPREGFDDDTEYSDHAKQDFSNTVARRYGRDPNSYHVHYHRRVATHNGTKKRRVFLATNLAQGRHEVFIGDEDI